LFGCLYGTLVTKPIELPCLTSLPSEHINSPPLLIFSSYSVSFIYFPLALFPALFLLFFPLPLPLMLLSVFFFCSSVILCVMLIYILHSFLCRSLPLFFCGNFSSLLHFLSYLFNAVNERSVSCRCAGEQLYATPALVGIALASACIRIPHHPTQTTT